MEKKKLWGGRFEGQLDADAAGVNSSISFALSGILYVDKIYFNDLFSIGGFSFQKDRDVYYRISGSHFDTQLQNANIAFLYGSGLPLPMSLRPLAQYFDSSLLET